MICAIGAAGTDATGMASSEKSPVSESNAAHPGSSPARHSANHLNAAFRITICPFHGRAKATG